MFISRIHLNKEKCSFPQIVNIVKQGNYQEHQLIWKFFEFEPHRKFLFRKVQTNGWPEFIVLSDHCPQQVEGEMWLLETREFVPNFNVGDRVSIAVKLNPIIEVNNKKHCPINHYKKIHPQWRDYYNNQEVIHSQIYDWWIKRVQTIKSIGITPVDEESFIVSGYMKNMDFKKKTGQQITFNTVDISGNFLITNPEVFMDNLLQGIGSSKSMGCGLILITSYSKG